MMKLLQEASQRNVLLLVATVLALAFYSFIGLDRVWPRVPYGYDFMHYYSGVLALKMGIRDVYSGDEYQALAAQLSQGQWRMMNAYFPGFFVFMLPLSLFTFDNAYLIFTAVTLLTFLLVTPWLGQQLFRQRPLGTLTGMGLAVFSIYTGAGMDCLALGQVGFLIASLVFVTFILCERNYPLLAGAALGVAALVKAWPAFLLLYFVSRRLWKALLGFVLGYGLPSLLAACFWGLSVYPHLFRTLKSLGYQSNPVNQSLTGWLVGFCGLDLSVVRPLHLLATLLVVAGLGLLHWKQPRFPRGLLYGLCVLCACILAPWSWPHHHIVLLFPLLALLERTTRNPLVWNWLGAWALSLLLLLDGEIVIDRLAAYLHLCAAQSGMIFVLMVSSCVLILAAGWAEEKKEVVRA